MTLQASVASLRTNMDIILEALVLESEALSVEPAEGMVIGTLFSTTTAPSPLPREHTKRHRSRDDNETLYINKECLELEAARRASLIDEEARQMRAQEVVAG